MKPKHSSDLAQPRQGTEAPTSPDLMQHAEAIADHHLCEATITPVMPLSHGEPQPADIW